MMTATTIVEIVSQVPVDLLDEALMELRSAVAANDKPRILYWFGIAARYFGVMMQENLPLHWVSDAYTNLGHLAEKVLTELATKEAIDEINRLTDEILENLIIRPSDVQVVDLRKLTPQVSS
jgi:hypothetical protein